MRRLALLLVAGALLASCGSDGPSKVEEAQCWRVGEVAEELTSDIDAPSPGYVRLRPDSTTFVRNNIATFVAIQCMRDKPYGSADPDDGPVYQRMHEQSVMAYTCWLGTKPSLSEYRTCVASGV